MPLKLGACTACPHDRPLAEALEVLKANFRRLRRNSASSGRRYRVRPKLVAIEVSGWGGTGPGPVGRSANHLDQATIAHLPGHKTAKAIWASNADAESR